jgi:hypothetical protein
MKNKLFFVFFLFLLLSLTASSDSPGTHVFTGMSATKNSEEDPQSTQKPKYDYMSSFLSRNTKPLGLKDNAPLRKFLNQPSINWALRAGGRHILN